ncbi:MAG: cytochrome c biogenesis protein CcdA [bacterium]|nr:cytochrome c biogenesis protein CcdA [bacterium]
MNKKTIIVLSSVVLFVAVFLFFRFSDFGQSILWTATNEGKHLLPLVLVAALIDSINPCAISVLFLTIAFLLSIKTDRIKILKIGGVYIFGIFTVYILIGLGLLKALHFFNTPHFMAKLAAVLVIFLGVVGLLNYFFPNFPIKFKLPSASHGQIAKLIEKGSLSAAFILGIFVGLCEFPCTGGPYLMILGMLHDADEYLKGLGYLLVYNMVFVLPLVVMLSLAGDKHLYESVAKWKSRNIGKAHLVGSALMLLLGVLILAL